jgi:biopolymer transport protein ExbB
MQTRWWFRAGWIVLGVGLAAPALAQNGGGRVSLLDIFWQGIEVPTYLIVAGSFVVIALIIEHFLSVRAPTVAPPDEVQRARARIEARNFRQCLDDLRASPTFFANVMTAALQHARHGFEAMHAAALEKSGELSGRMFRKVEYLNIIGNLGPLLGLLGTVWGMIRAFGELGAAGGAGGDLAKGISEALVNTLGGLALAILGIGFYGVCRNRIDAFTVSATVQVLDLLEYFRPAGTGGRSAESTSRPAAAVEARPSPAAPPTTGAAPK